MSSLKLVQRVRKSPLDEFQQQLQQRLDNVNEVGPEQVAETGGIIFPNGRCIELFKDDTGRLGLFDSSDDSLTQRIEYQGRTYVPPIIHPSLLEVLRIPAGPLVPDSTANNFKEICTLFMERGISEQAAKALTYWALSTWFTELFPVAPCLILTGSRPEAHLVLQLLACVVRHGLPLADINLPEFRSLPMHIQPTLLISRLSPGMWRLLSASNYPSFYLPTRDGLADPYCAKAVYAGTRVVDADLDGALCVHLASSHAKLPVISDLEQRKLAADFQSRLLVHRIRYIGKVRDSEFDVPALRSELRILARVLGSAIADAPELRAGLVKLLQQYQDEIAAGNAFKEESIAVEALLSHSHSEEPDQLLYVGQLADTANKLLKDRGSREKLEPKALGWTIRNSLGLSPKRNAKGFGIKLTEEVRRRIHQLARECQVLATNDAVAGCSHCADILASDARERKLEVGAKKTESAA